MPFKFKNQRFIFQLASNESKSKKNTVQNTIKKLRRKDLELFSNNSRSFHLNILNELLDCSLSYTKHYHTYDTRCTIK